MLIAKLVKGTSTQAVVLAGNVDLCVIPEATPALRSAQLPDPMDYS